MSTLTSMYVTACQTVDLLFALPNPHSATDWSNMLSFVNAYISAYMTIGPQNVRVRACIVL